MTPIWELEGFLGFAVTVALVVLAATFILIFLRIVRGPSLADRVVALDLLAILAMGFVGLRVIATGQALYLEIAIALGLVAFLATVYFARLIETRGHELHHGYDKAPGQGPEQRSDR